MIPLKRRKNIDEIFIFNYCSESPDSLQTRINLECDEHATSIWDSLRRAE